MQLVRIKCGIVDSINLFKERRRLFHKWKEICTAMTTSCLPGLRICLNELKLGLPQCSTLITLEYKLFNCISVQVNTYYRSED